MLQAAGPHRAAALPWTTMRLGSRQGDPLHPARRAAAAAHTAAASTLQGGGGRKELMRKHSPFAGRSRKPHLLALCRQVRQLQRHLFTGRKVRAHP